MLTNVTRSTIGLIPHAPQLPRGLDASVAGMPQGVPEAVSQLLIP